MNRTLGGWRWAAAGVLLASVLPGAVRGAGLVEAVDFRAMALPASADGWRPTQAWLSVGATPDGTVLVGASDHTTNSALYRVAPNGAVRLVGDARSASMAAGNWSAGETAEKFHVRPTYFRGKAYIATADFTGGDDGYLKRRGFHWYAYDQAADRFSDLSRDEPGGVGGAHASVVALTVAAERGLLYGLDTPRGLLFRYDVARRATTNLGRPPFFTADRCMPCRYIWVGGGGRVYLSVSTVECVVVYDPVHGWERRPEWRIAVGPDGAKVFRTGTESADRRWVYLADVDGRFYRYDRETDTFGELGQASTTAGQFLRDGHLKLRALNVSRDGERLYFINDNAPVAAFWEWDIAHRTTRRLCLLSELDSRLGAPRYPIHCGNESWDNAGHLYFCAFGEDPAHPVELLLCRLDPERLRTW